MPKLPHAAIRQVTILNAGAPDAVQRTIDALRRGNVVSFPTDTVYALATSLSHPEALRRLYSIKGRPDSKPIPVLLSSAADLDLLTEGVDRRLVRLVVPYWPGALTVVVPARPHLPGLVTATNQAGVRTVAVRVPDHPLARTIIEGAGGALAATSANISGLAPALTATEVNDQLGHRLDLLLDGGRAPGGVASTIVELGDAGPVVLRQGSISGRDLERRWRSLAATAPPTTR